MPIMGITIMTILVAILKIENTVVNVNSRIDNIEVSVNFKAVDEKTFSVTEISVAIIKIVELTKTIKKVVIDIDTVD